MLSGNRGHPTGNGRSVVLRVSLDADGWRRFEAMRDTVRRDSPEVNVPDGDEGTRLVLRAWIEEAIKDAAIEG